MQIDGLFSSLFLLLLPLLLLIVLLGSSIARCGGSSVGAHSDVCTLDQTYLYLES
ncbi:hypothetical protein LZ31DRAFT_560821 [Colletotrichum somersetense]|nr:hypothetical protein LZ31DRAFT_560821 [Colletotrichum somersetense]